jgi:hypothetical protein
LRGRSFGSELASCVKVVNATDILVEGIHRTGALLARLVCEEMGAYENCHGGEESDGTTVTATFFSPRAYPRRFLSVPLMLRSDWNPIARINNPARSIERNKLVEGSNQVAIPSAGHRIYTSLDLFHSIARAREDQSPGSGFVISTKIVKL